MKNQALFSLKDKSKKLKCRLLQFLFGALRVKKLNSNLSSSCSVRYEIKSACIFFSIFLV